MPPIPPATGLSETVARLLGAHSQRLTPTRERIVGVLAAAPGPLTIPEILDASGGLAQSSVYRNLAVLEAAGVVRRIVTGDDYAHFELAEALTEHHHHLICAQCGTVSDVTLPAEVEHRLDAALPELAAARGFVLDHHRLDLIGRCERCVAAER